MKSEEMSFMTTEEEPLVVVQIDKEKILEELEHNASYSERVDHSEENQDVKLVFPFLEEIQITQFSSQYTQKDNPPKYIGKLQREHHYYQGGLTNNFLRHGLGFNLFGNGSVYLGEWMNNLRHGKGIYNFHTSQKNDYIEIYHGEFEDSKKGKMGVYGWVRSDLEDCDEYSSEFDLYIGEFSNGEYSHGLYLTKISDFFFAYFGHFNNEGKKSDMRGIYYDSNKDRTFLGTIDCDKIMSGYLITFVTNQSSDNLVKFKLDGTTRKSLLEMGESDPIDIIYIEFENDVPKQVEKGNSIDKKIRDSKSGIADRFKNVLTKDFDIFKLHDYLSRIMKITKTPANKDPSVSQDLDKKIKANISDSTLKFINDGFPLSIFKRLKQQVFI